MMEREHITPETLTDYAHGELHAGDDARVHAHLADCTVCAEAFDEEKRLTEILRDQARLQERELPPGLAERIYATAASQRPRTPAWERIAGFLRPAILVPAAAAAMLAIYFGLSHAPARATAIDAAYYFEDHDVLATTVPFDDGAIAPAMMIDAKR